MTFSCKNKYLSTFPTPVLDFSLDLFKESHIAKSILIVETFPQRFCYHWRCPQLCLLRLYYICLFSIMQKSQSSICFLLCLGMITIHSFFHAKLIAHPHLYDYRMWCVFVSPGVVGAFSSPGRQQRHSGLHHSRQRSVWHYRRPGHHHHVCLCRHTQCGKRWVLRWPQVRAWNDWFCIQIQLWKTSQGLQGDWSLKSAPCLSFILKWHNDVLAAERGGSLWHWKLQITQKIWMMQGVTHLRLFIPSSRLCSEPLFPLFE